MKLFIHTLVSTALIAVSFCLFSCDDNTEGFGSTGRDGLPSAFKTENQTTYLSYSGNRLLQMMNQDGFTTTFNYKGDELRGISYAPPSDPNIADGNGYTGFEKEGNKIIVKQSGEPSMDISYNQEIELDGNGFPTKITDLGAFQMTSEGYKKVWDGKYYYALTFEPSTKNLLKLEKFNLEDSTLITTSSFQYSNHPGSMSQVELPLWFFSYHSFASGISSRQYLNYRNTLTEETVTDGKTGTTHTTYYKYTYNKNAYPVAVDNGEEKMDIRY